MIKLKNILSESMPISDMKKGKTVKLTNALGKTFDEASIVDSRGKELESVNTKPMHKILAIKDLQDGDKFSTRGTVSKVEKDKDGIMRSAYYNHEVFFQVHKKGKSTFIKVDKVVSKPS